MARLGPSIPKDDEGNKMPKKLSRALKEGRPGTERKNYGCSEKELPESASSIKPHSNYQTISLCQISGEGIDFLLILFRF